mmetsp:Transcript_53124/g.95928  ORF Transcript_53124/g.95928 Transcript_53124/m.95928 type:complete len:125 (-) Transcript_53124:1287-1661(-)
MVAAKLYIGSVTKIGCNTSCSRSALWYWSCGSLFLLFRQRCPSPPETTAAHAQKEEQERQQLCVDEQVVACNEKPRALRTFEGRLQQLQVSACAKLQQLCCPLRTAKFLEKPGDGLRPRSIAGL